MTTVVSLREINEVTFRALKTHGASHGEASTAARLVQADEIIEGRGLTAVLDDVTREPWQPTAVEISAPIDVSGARAVVLGSASDNRVLREGPLAVELVAGDPQLDVVGAPGAVAGSALLDPVLLEIAREDCREIAAVLCTTEQPTAGAVTAATGLTAHVRWAHPDGSTGIATLDTVPTLCHRVLGGPGVLALRDIGLLDGFVPGWIHPAGRAVMRARAAADGITVDAASWWALRTAARRYLVPD